VTDANAGFRIKKYHAKLSPDLSNVGTMVGYDTGFSGQSQLQFSDLLGNYNLTVGIGIYGSIKESDLYVSWLNRAGRTNYSLSAFQFRRRYGFLGSARGVESSRQTYRGLQAAAIRPFDKFTRLETSLRLASVSGRFQGETPDEIANDPSLETMRTFVGPGVAYVFDSSLYGYAGPIKGRRMRLSAEGGIGELEYATLEADVRQYWNVEKYYTLAGRLYAASSHGASPQTLYLGGAQSLRGYDYGSLLGNHALLANVEFRFPLLRHLALGWPLPLEFGYIEGVLFADGATAWDGRFGRTSRALSGDPVGRAALLSGGFGARISFGYMVLKFDWARLYDTGTGRMASGSSVALGTDF
jgi:outer membrane protein assembly factor BamA